MDQCSNDMSKNSYRALFPELFRSENVWSRFFYCGKIEEEKTAKSLMNCWVKQKHNQEKQNIGTMGTR